MTKLAGDTKKGVWKLRGIHIQGNMDAGESVENPQQPRRKWPAQWGKLKID